MKRAQRIEIEKQIHQAFRKRVDETHFKGRMIFKIADNKIDGWWIAGDLRESIKIASKTQGWRLVSSDIELLVNSLKMHKNIIELNVAVTDSICKIFISDVYKREHNEWPVQRSEASKAKTEQPKKEKKMSGRRAPEDIITERQFYLLSTLSRCPNGRVTGLKGNTSKLWADKARETMRYVTGSQRELEKSGLITRNVRGKRTYSVSITPFGETVVEKAILTGNPQALVYIDKYRTQAAHQPELEAQEPKPVVQPSPLSLLEPEIKELRSDVKRILNIIDEEQEQSVLSEVQHIVSLVNLGKLSPLMAIAQIEKQLEEA